jgi:hypothetical protein
VFEAVLSVVSLARARVGLADVHRKSLYHMRTEVRTPRGARVTGY